MDIIPFGFDPFDDFRGMMPSRFMRRAFPKVDVQETEKEVIVTADVPGMDPNKISIEVEGDMLKMSGSTEEEKEEKGKNFFRKERSSRSFNRAIQLPSLVKDEGAKATTKNGTLRIVLQKMERSEGRGKKIPIEEM